MCVCDRYLYLFCNDCCFSRYLFLCDHVICISATVSRMMCACFVKRAKCVRRNICYLALYKSQFIYIFCITFSNSWNWELCATSTFHININIVKTFAQLQQKRKSQLNREEVLFSQENSLERIITNSIIHLFYYSWILPPDK